jgi:hypothetical protein
MFCLAFMLLFFLAFALFVIAVMWAVFLALGLWLLKRPRDLMRTAGLFAIGFVSSLILFGLANLGVLLFGDFGSFFSEMIELPYVYYGFPFVFMRRDPSELLGQLNCSALAADVLVTIIVCACLGFALTKAKRLSNTDVSV